jgi:PAS domain S-box-containing protein
MEKPLVLERSPDQKPDELTDLVTSLNQMREQLRVTYGQMLELNQSLERRVLERTAELSLEVGMRRQNELALLRSEGQLRAVLDVALIGIIVIDENGTIEVINPAARELFGYSSSEILGRNVKVLMPHEYSQHHDGYLQRYRETGKRQVVGGQRDVAGLRKDGSEFPLRLSVSESIGGGRLFIGTVQDLTERRTFEAALIQAKLTAEQANQAKSDFLSRMSHELRTPLNSVLGYAQLLLTDRREPLTKAQQESVDSIVMGGRHLLELVNDVLDLARVEANRLELKSARVDVAMLTSNCLRTVAPLAQERNVQLHLPENTASLWGMADETRLRQAILNLLSNAINYNKPEGHVFVTLHCEEGWIRLEVRDTGIGFDAAQAGKLFQPFTRLHKGLAVAGNGIGLALTKHLMEIMGGCITATGEPGVGASFSLYVPLTDA